MSGFAHTPVNFSLESTFQDVRQTLTAIMSAVEPSFDEVKLAPLELCLAETLNNIVEHSYKEQPGNPISVTVGFDSDELIVTIEDNGEPNAALGDIANSPSPDALAEGGFGLSLIQTIASRVFYERRGASNITKIWYS